MKKEQLAMEILRQLARNAAETGIKHRFAYWHSRYHGYPFCNDDDALQEAINWLDRLKGCFEEEEINEIFDKAEEDYRAEVDPQVWAMFKNNELLAESDRPVCEHCGRCRFVD